MKILFLGQSLDARSGWGRYAWEVVRRVSSRHEVEVLVEEASGKDCEIPALKNFSNFLDIVTNFSTVKNAAMGFDVIHALDGWPYAVYAASCRKPFFVTAVGTYAVAPLDRFGKSWLLKRAYYRARKIFCISNYTKNEITKRTEFKNLEVVHLGVDHDKFRSLNLPRDFRLLVSVGAVKPRKGYHVALQAFGLLAKKYPQAHYKIIGQIDQDKYFEKLQDYIRQENLQAKVEFIKEASDEDLVKLYNQASLFLLLPVNHKGSFEGFGLVFLEAALCGLPVVGTLGNGDEDAINDQKSGFLVPQNDPQAAFEAIDKLWSNKEPYENFSRQTLEFASKFTWDKTVEHYLQAYQNAVLERQN